MEVILKLATMTNDKDILKQHAIDFSDWRKEYEFLEGFKLRRAYKKAGGIFSTIGKTTEQMYDIWRKRLPMSFHRAMELVNSGKEVSRPRLHAVQGVSIILKDGHIIGQSEEIANLIYPFPFSEQDCKATDWFEILPPKHIEQIG